MYNKYIFRKRNFILLVLICLFLITFLITGCSDRQKTNTAGQKGIDHKLIVYTSLFVLEDFAEKIGGEHVVVNNLIPNGINPHDWEPSISDITGLENAHVLILNGAGLEHWKDKFMGTIDNSSLITVDTSEGIELFSSVEESSQHDHGKVDPHVWLDPLLAKKQAESIKDAFISADPTNMEDYENNYQKLALKFDQLHQKYENTLKDIQNKKFVVSHQAFSYLANRYGLEQIPLTGIDADSESTPTHLAEIARLCQDNNIQYIFYEEYASTKLADTIANEIGLETLLLSPIGTISQEEITQGEDYFSKMEQNLNNLIKALE